MLSSSSSSSPSVSPSAGETEDLASATKLLASRQRSSNLPRIARKASSSAKPITAGSPASASAPLPSSSTVTQPGTSAELKVDQAAIDEITAQQRDGQNDVQQLRNGAATSPNDDISGDSSKRMTVLLEGEMPEDQASSSTTSSTQLDGSAPAGEVDAVEGEQDADDGPLGEDEAETPRPSTPAQADGGSTTTNTKENRENSAPPQSQMSEPSSSRISSSVSSSSARRLPSASAANSKRVRPPSLLSLHSPSKKGAATTHATTHERPFPPQRRESLASSSDNDSSDDEDDGEEPEPSLKYQRLKGSIPDILKRDTASAFAVCEKFLVLGTHAGMVFVLDFSGNLVKAFRSHSASVLDLSIDSSMEFIAAAGMDGLLSISSLSSAEHYAFDFKRPMRSVSVEPGFGRKNTRAFVCGGMAGALVNREKGWLGHKETVIHAGEGPIWAVRWRGSLIAWANDAGVRIYDTNTRNKITFINAPTGQDRVDLFRPNLFWQDDRTLTIAWADQIKVAKIRERRNFGESGRAVTAAGLGQSSPALYVEVTKIFQMDCAISGLAPYGDDLLVLAYLTEAEDESGAEDSDESEGDESRLSSSKRSAIRRRAFSQRPELRIIDPDDGQEKSSDVLSLSGFERFGCNDYHLVPSHAISAKKPSNKSSQQKHQHASTHAQEDLFYIVSPQDVIIARPRDLKDHIEWLLEHKRYETALTAVEDMGTDAAKGAGFDAVLIGKDYLSHLVNELHDYDCAAAASVKILGSDVAAWEEWIFLFLERGRIDRLVEAIPTSDPILPNVAYDMVLASFLKTDTQKLRHTLELWPPELYSTQAVALAIEDKLQQEQKRQLQSGNVEEPPSSEATMLMDILADLYVRNRQPGKSLPYYLQLKRPGVFDLIRENNLILDVRDQARQLIEFEQEVIHRNQSEKKDKMEDIPAAEEDAAPSQAVQLLVENVDSIPPQRVVPQLESLPLYLHRYLSALFAQDPHLVIPYSDLQISLYARFAPARLGSYLRSMSSYYSFEEAFGVCERYDLVPEMVFLLGRVGDNKRALNLIIERLGDVERAIDFAKEQNDDELWEDVLRYSESRPPFIRGLLENVGGVEKIDPVQLIRRIQDGLEIPGLRDAVRKILSDYSLQVSLLEGCLQVMGSEGKALIAERNLAQSLGIVIVTSEAMEEDSAAATVGSALAADTRCRGCGKQAVRKDRQVQRKYVVGTDGSLSPSKERKLAGGTPANKKGDHEGGGNGGALSEKSDNTIITFLCRHSYHLSCLLPQQSIPTQRDTLGEGKDGDEALALGEISMTVTQRRQLAKWGQADTLNGGKADVGEAQWGPAIREAWQRRRWHQGQSSASRLKVPIRARGGCPACKAKSNGSSSPGIAGGDTMN